MSSRIRIIAFALICAVSVLVSVGYVWLRKGQVAALPGDSAGEAPLAARDPSGIAALPREGSHGDPDVRPDAAAGPAVLPNVPFVIFRDTALGPDYGRLATVLLDDASKPRASAELRCERAYFAAGYGVCLTADRGVMTAYKAYLFDRSLRLVHTLPLKGIPSRTRVSPDGRHAAITVFVSGHSYSPGTFSTHTEIYRTVDGSRVVELEQFSVERDGKPFRAVDFNYWGVTFAPDGNRFYATLATSGQNLLIEGNIDTRQARVVHAGVECPSLSPDGRRLVFKRLGKSGWRLYALDLSTGAETPLPEERSVDDQVEWLDPERVLYALGNDIWVVPVEGEEAPSVFLANAYSPAIVRP